MQLVGLTSDELVKKLGGPRRRKVVGSEGSRMLTLPNGEEVEIHDLIVHWFYPTVTVELRYRDGEYKVMEVVE